MNIAQKTILLVEDEVFIAMSEALQLQKESYAVVHAYNGEEAIAKVKAASPAIDLILMDINLGPGLDGTEAAQIILQDYDIPIVFLSSHTEPEVVAKTEKITSYGYVVKGTGITVLAASIRMAFKLHDAYKTIRHTNEGLRLAQAASHAGTWDWDIVHNVFDWSPELLSLFGMPPDTVAGFEAWMEIVHPDDREGAKHDIQEAIDNKTELVSDSRIVLPGGDIRWIRATGKIYYEGAQPSRMIGLCMDITERKHAEEKLQKTASLLQSPNFSSTTADITRHKQAEEALQQALAEKEILMRELQHRVKNSLAMAAGVIELELDNLPDDRTRAIFANTRTRLRTMSALYDRLNQTGHLDRIDLRDYLQTLIGTLSKAYLAPSSPVTIEPDIAAVELGTKQAIPLGLIVNELVINALKHAFPAGQTGVIRVKLLETNGKVALRVADNGTGPAPGPPHSDNPGLGLKLVEMLTRQLGGELTIEEERGITTRVTFEKERE